MLHMNKLTVAYIRVSTTKQSDGNGLDQQRASICAWATVNNVRIDEWVTEQESGMKEHREQIQQLRNRAANKEIGRIIVDRMDRLGRRLVVCEQLYAEFTGLGVEVACTQHQLDASPHGTLMRHIMGGFAEYQRSEWLARMRTCRKLSVTRKGRYGGGDAPYGYKVAGGGKLAIDHATAKIVRRIFALSSDHSINAISRVLAAEGFANSTGRPLAPMQVKRILDRRDFYAGKAPLQDTTYEPGVVPAIPPILTGDESMHGTQQKAATMG